MTPRFLKLSEAAAALARVPDLPECQLALRAIQRELERMIRAGEAFPKEQQQ